MDNECAAAVLTTICFVSVLLVSGCITTGGQASYGNGVMIENFEIDPQKVQAGEEFNIRLRMRNEGSLEAESVYPRLYNIGTAFGGDKLEISCHEQCRPGISLLPPDPEKGILGESETCIWGCISPRDIGNGLSVTFNPSIRLYYVYATHLIKSITIASQDELRSFENQGMPLPNEVVSATDGPIKLDIVFDGPVRYSYTESTIKFPINVVIQNVGGGTACLPQVASNVLPSTISHFSLMSSCDAPENWNKVMIYLKIDNNMVNMFCNPSENQLNVVGLWEGKKTTLRCDVEMPSPGFYSPGIVQKNLKFSAYYAYFLDRTASIEVKGRDTGF